MTDRLTQEAKDAIANAGKQSLAANFALQRDPEPAAPNVTDEMIQAACIAGYGVGTDKDTNLYKLMKRALTAALKA